ncbi:MAG: YdeI/OmpD-associated family protein [Bacteroidota bacterium]
MNLVLRVTQAPNGSFYLPIPEEAALKILATFGRRILCVVSERPVLHCAVLRQKDLGYYIMLGKTSRARLGVELGEELMVQIRQDTSKYQAAVPEELLAVLQTDPEGEARFGALTAGKKRSIIHYINTAKQSETRINRALKLVERLKLGVTSQKELFRP